MQEQKTAVKTHRFASVLYKLVYKNRIIDAGSRSAMKKRLRQIGTPDSDGIKPFIGIGDPREAGIGKVWNSAFN